MLMTPDKIPVRTRLPLAAWAIAAVVTLASLMFVFGPCIRSFASWHAERRAACAAENRGASGQSLKPQGVPASLPGRRAVRPRGK